MAKLTSLTASPSRSYDVSCHRSDVAAVRRALEPLMSRLGACVVPVEQATPSDIPIEWKGITIGAARLPGLSASLPSLLREVDAVIGRTPARMTVSDRQRAIQYLDAKGAFLLRRSVEHVAAHLAISKTTVYAYRRRRSDLTSLPTPIERWFDR
jgi:hypothetical protein